MYILCPTDTYFSFEEPLLSFVNVVSLFENISKITGKNFTKKNIK